MSSALAFVKKKLPKQHEEEERDYEDRMVAEAFVKLYYQKKRSQAEEQELAELQKKWIAIQIATGGYIPQVFADKDLQESALRLHGELSTQFGEKTALKTLLIDRLVCAWNMAVSFETQFCLNKYKKEPDGNISMNLNDTKIRMQREIRQGIESANDQIIRLAQTLQNLTNPPIQVRVKNAFIAQNQQVNQGIPAKDLENSQGQQTHATPAR